MRSAIMGCGAQGTILGVLATMAGEDVTLIDVNKAHVDAMNEKGATLVGDIDVNVKVKAITPDQMSGIYDIVFVMCKQTANAVAIPQIAKFIGPDSVVCTLQNGVPEPYVASIVGEDRTVGGTVMWGGEQHEPGIVIVTTGKEMYRKIDIGTISGEYTPACEKVEKYLQCQGKVAFFPNFMGARWAKLWVNAGMSGISACTGSTFEEDCNDELAVTCIAHIGNEVVRVAEAAGIKMEKIMPLYEISDLKFDDLAGRNHAIAKIKESHTQPGQKASMLVDMEKGRRGEVDFINGYVCDTGKKVGVPTPFCDTVVRIVHEFEEGKRPMPTLETAKEFVIPELK